ncbi:MAG TPA: ABC transporter permease [Kofleriaceae bacterium]|jgi:lipoprotein-releasing system permease protein
MWLWIVIVLAVVIGGAAVVMTDGARWITFDLRVGWRYLYSGRRDRVMLMGAGVSAAISVIGLVLMLAAIGGPLGVLMLVLGLISTAICGLLAVFSVFTSVSVLGVAFGVAALTIVLAVTTGFQRQFEDKVLGVNAHVIVLKSQTTFAEYRDVMDKAKKIDPDVLAVQPFIFAEMLVTRGKGELSGVAIKGVDPKLVKSVLDLDSHMIEGSVDSLAKEPPAGQPPPIIMGKELAHKLKAKLGDDVTVVVPLSNIDWDAASMRSTAPRSRKFRVTGIFYSGFDEYDRRLMYCSLQDAQDLEGRGDQVMGVEMKVKNIDRASAIAEHLEKALGGPPYQVEDWYQLNQNLFTALKLQKLALVIILTLIIIVATVNMVSALTMMVTDKTREIAILKSMGSTSSSVARIFLVLGIAIGGVGTVIGVAIGLVTCFVVHAYGYHLDPKVYLIDRLPIDVVPIEIVAVAGITLVISLIATLFPSQSAAALTPVEGLRYD